MSDDVEKDERPAKGKKGAPPPSDREKARVEPVPKDEKFFEWLESLFFGAENFPEALDVRVVRGKDYATMGPRIKQYLYPAGRQKPTKEEIVKLSNEILYLIQRDCDVHRKRVVYHVAAIHFARGPEPYERWLLDCQPGATYRNGSSPRHSDGDGGDGDGDEEGSVENRFGVQILKHHERLVDLLGGAFEGIMDRMDRMLERSLQRNAQLETRVEKLLDQVERARSLEMEREQQRLWNDVKRDAAKRGLEIGSQIVPPLVNRLIGQSVVESEPLEVVTLKNFFKEKSEGGQFTPEEGEAVFGKWDVSDPQSVKLIRPGILTPAQSHVLIKVMSGEMSPAALDQLVPGGSEQILPEQAMALQQIFGMERLAPLLLLFQSRQKAQ